MFLFLTVFQSFFMTLPDADGWVVLDREKPVQEEIEEDGKGVLFSLFYKDKLFWVRFSTEPGYSYEEKGIVLEAKEGLQTQRLEIIDTPKEDDFFSLRKEELEKKVFLEEAVEYEDGRIHFSYWLDGQWVAEEWEFYDNCSYFFCTKSDKVSSDLHFKFFSSLIR